MPFFYVHTFLLVSGHVCSKSYSVASPGRLSPQSAISVITRSSNSSNSSRYGVCVCVWVRVCVSVCMCVCACVCVCVTGILQGTGTEAVCRSGSHLCPSPCTVKHRGLPVKGGMSVSMSFPTDRMEGLRGASLKMGSKLLSKSASRLRAWLWGWKPQLRHQHGRRGRKYDCTHGMTLTPLFVSRSVLWQLAVA